MRRRWIGLAAAVLVGCAANRPHAKAARPAMGPQGTRPASELMPLNLGVSWTYRRTFLGESGEFKVTVVRKDEEGYFVDDAGGRLMLTPMGLRDADRYLLLSPLETGQRWRVQVQPNVAEHYEITEDNATVEVPAGRFEHCLVVEAVTNFSAARRMVIRSTYAPKVGMVRSETRMEDNQGRKVQQVLLELVAYTIP